MKLRRKSTLLTVVVLSLATLVLSTVAVLAFRAFSVDAARQQARMAAEIVRVALTEEMVQGVIGERDHLFARLHDIPGLLEVHVVRSSAVDEQFGKGHRP